MRTRSYAHTFIRLHAYTFIRSYAYTHTRLHSYVHTRLHSYAHTLIHSYAHTLIRSYVHTFIRSYAHTFIRLHAHAHAHAQPSQTPHNHTTDIYCSNFDMYYLDISVLAYMLQQFCINSFPYYKILDLSKLKAFADQKL